jgi:hypothetical protein
LNTLCDADQTPQQGVIRRSYLEEQTVARSFHDAAVMFLDFGIGQLAPQRFQAR